MPHVSRGGMDERLLHGAAHLLSRPKSAPMLNAALEKQHWPARPISSGVSKKAEGVATRGESHKAIRAPSAYTKAHEHQNCCAPKTRCCALSRASAGKCGPWACGAGGKLLIRRAVCAGVRCVARGSRSGETARPASPTPHDAARDTSMTRPDRVRGTSNPGPARGRTPGPGSRPRSGRGRPRARRRPPSGVRSRKRKRGKHSGRKAKGFVASRTHHRLDTQEGS